MPASGDIPEHWPMSQRFCGKVHPQSSPAFRAATVLTVTGLVYEHAHERRVRYASDTRLRSERGTDPLGLSHRRRRPLLTLCLFLAMVGGGDGAANAAFPGANGVIAVNFANRSYIYAIRPDGTGRRKLVGPTIVRGVPFSPAWSPDGKRLLFVRADRADGELYTFDVATRRERTLSSFSNSGEPSWSPSARQLVASVVYTDGPSRISVLRNISADSWKPITGQLGVSDVAPVWSPRGNWIAFARLTVGVPVQTSTLHVVRPDGTGLRPLVRGNWPDWSPDGREVVFERDGDIYRVRLDGTGLRRLTRSPRGETQPEWSPDGRKIAFARGTNLIIMNADGSRPHQIAQRIDVGTGFDWQPLPR